MARKLEFQFGNETFSVGIHKVDRAKLYGRVQTETFDAFDKECTLASIARDGRTIIPSGGTASGYVNTEGLWVTRDELIPIDRDGKDVPEVESSFKVTINLSKEVDIDTFLDHPIRLAYRLDPETELNATFLQKLKDGAIFQFPFSYRGGIYADPAFLLRDEDGVLWMLIGHQSDIEFVGFEQAAICAARAEELGEDDSGETDAFDFDML